MFLTRYIDYASVALKTLLNCPKESLALGADVLFLAVPTVKAALKQTGAYSSFVQNSRHQITSIRWPNQEGPPRHE